MNRREATGYANGIRAMRNLIVEEFDKHRAGSFSGGEVAQLVAQMPGPPITELGSDDEEKPTA